MKKRYLALVGLLVAVHTYASDYIVLRRQFNISGVVVASACSVSVESEGSQNGVINFGQYNQAKEKGGLIKPFSIKLYEIGASVPGCSAFLAGIGDVSLTFGEQGQLDTQGVVTHGAGNNIRVAITAVDNEASHHKVITSKNAKLMYPKIFSTRGVFNFNAKAEGLDSATPGDYRGSLSLVVSYK
ncbi:type 1 fimbrial protein (plasmid) [Photobacterium damselae subsp. damselae]|uniref:fimbrial protein n=1 Tax=Photobacterium damselae TaxID=38293 RepID=UPI000A2FD0E6|nr:type 1 fimbrial protein [Photobacterium damselae]ARR51830.1 hypothetical protein CAY62_20685 [Photobacterium damselae subsp. damselae]QAY37595.1 type 1 fimbrial protein [Photobacterium damselae subsp. damselae]